MSPKPGEEPVPKKSLFDDSTSPSDDDQDDGGATLAPSSATLNINEEYAHRFEHNKKREELHRLQEKYKADGIDDQASESSEEDEDEDEDAHLVTEDLEAEISATLQAIKNKDPRIYDKNAVFYKPFDPEAEAPKEKKERPLFLRDYHRERYLNGDVGTDDEDTSKPKTYAQEQADLKKSIVSEFHAAAEDEEWSDDDAFLRPAKRAEDEKPAENGVHPSRAAAIKLTELDVANADKNPEEFLSRFMASKAWAPTEGSKWQAFESDEGEDNPDIADEIEHAYNIRFEDPTKSNEILKTYSRNLAASKSVRKEELTGRKRQRALEKERKEAEKREREEERARLRRLKIEEASEKLQKIKQAAGLSGKALQEEDWAKFLAEDWSDERWEEEMKKRFGDEYYAEKDEDLSSLERTEDSENGSASKEKKKPKKPKWDDDIDIRDIVPDFEDDEKPSMSLSDLEDPTPAAGGPAEEDDSDSDSERPSKKRKTSKDVKKDKIAAKRQARRELAKIEAIVDAQMEIDNPRTLTSSSKKTTGGFRYRETSPNSFGLTARDILLAPSDAALNEFAGLKKLAPFRDAEKKRKDKKKLGKKARLRQWRREQFGPEYEHTGPTFGFEKVIGEGQEKTAARGTNPVRVERTAKGRHGDGDGDDNKKNEAVDGIIEGERKKKRKRSKGKGKKEVAD